MLLNTLEIPSKIPSPILLPYVFMVLAGELIPKTLFTPFTNGVQMFSLTHVPTLWNAFFIPSRIPSPISRPFSVKSTMYCSISKFSKNSSRLSFSKTSLNLSIRNWNPSATVPSFSESHPNASINAPPINSTIGAIIGITVLEIQLMNGVRTLFQRFFITSIKEPNALPIFSIAGCTLSSNTSLNF